MTAKKEITRIINRLLFNLIGDWGEDESNDEDIERTVDDILKEVNK